jgi:hypothetical protein
MCWETAVIGQRLGADWHMLRREATPEEHGVMRGDRKAERASKSLAFSRRSAIGELRQKRGICGQP